MYRSYSCLTSFTCFHLCIWFFSILSSVHAFSVASVILMLCNHVDCGPPGSSVCGILQARILEWVAMPSSRGSSRPRGQMDISCVSRITGGFFATEPPEKPHFTTCCPAYYFEINPRYQFISSANISACIWIYTSFLTKSPNLNNFIILQAIKILFQNLNKIWGYV